MVRAGGTCKHSGSEGSWFLHPCHLRLAKPTKTQLCVCPE